MPICDGYTATKRIRDFEPTAPIQPSKYHPAVAGQVPIFAISASLHEHQRGQLLECGFSGFMLKPVDFARLNDLMLGAQIARKRDDNMYQPGRWERGGWLTSSTQTYSPTVSPLKTPNRTE